MALGLSDAAAGRLVGVSHVAIGKARKKGAIPTLSDGTIDPDRLAEWAEGRRTPRGGTARERLQVTAEVTAPIAAPAPVSTPVTASGAVPFACRRDAELARDSWVAELRRIEFERESEKVVDAAVVLPAIEAAAHQIRTRLLALPSEQAPRLHRCKTVVELEDALRALITEALEGLSGAFLSAKDRALP